MQEIFMLSNFQDNKSMTDSLYLTLTTTTIIKDLGLRVGIAKL